MLQMKCKYKTGALVEEMVATHLEWVGERDYERTAANTQEAVFCLRDGAEGILVGVAYRL